MPQVVGGERVENWKHFETESRTAGQKEAEVGELKSVRVLRQKGEGELEIGCTGSIVSLELGGLEDTLRRSKYFLGWQGCVWEEH